MKRATKVSYPFSFLTFYFNPRPREEGDLLCVECNEELKISIHALVKRATSCRILQMDNIRNFNPRPREEGDKPRLSKNYPTTYFNPRPREEGDYRLYPQEEQQGYFNPRPREEGDIEGFDSVTYTADFNPRPREEGD